MSAPAPRRPRVALVSFDVAERSHPKGLFAELIARTSDRIDYVVVTARLSDQVRHLVRWRRLPAPSGRRGCWMVFLLFGWVRLLRSGADLVHTNGGMPVLTSRVDLAWVHYSLGAAELLAGVNTRHGGSPVGRLLRAATLAIERWCYSPRRTRVIAAVSHGQMEQMRRLHPRAHIEVVPVFVDCNRFRPDPTARTEVRRELGVGEDELVAVFIGREWEPKGLPIAVEATGLTGRAWRLWVLGGPGASRSLERAAVRAGMQGRVELLGFRSDVERYCQAADALVLPTIYENLSRAMLEAAACELPLVVTRVNGVDEIVGDDEAGLIVDRDAPSVAAALERLADDPGLRGALGRAGRARVAAFSAERMVELTLAQYRRLLPAELAATLDQ